MLTMIIMVMVIIASAAVTYIVIPPRVTPVLPGQRWFMPGLGNILIIRITSGTQPHRPPRAHADVEYKLADGIVGYCSKAEIRGFGHLLPYTASLNHNDEKKSPTHKEDNYSTYSPPKGWSKHPQRSHNIIYDAEIISKTRRDGY